MIIPFDQAAITAAGMPIAVSADGTQAIFTIPQDDNPKPMMATARISDGTVELLPDRSFKHKTILAKLGIAIEPG